MIYYWIMSLVSVYARARLSLINLLNPSRPNCPINI